MPQADAADWAEVPHCVQGALAMLNRRLEALGSTLTSREAARVHQHRKQREEEERRPSCTATVTPRPSSVTPQNIAPPATPVGRSRGRSASPALKGRPAWAPSGTTRLGSESPLRRALPSPRRGVVPQQARRSIGRVEDGNLTPRIKPARCGPRQAGALCDVVRTVKAAHKALRDMSDKCFMDVLDLQRWHEGEGDLSTDTRPTLLGRSPSPRRNPRARGDGSDASSLYELTPEDVLYLVVVERLEAAVAEAVALCDWGVAHLFTREECLAHGLMKHHHQTEGDMRRSYQFSSAMRAKQRGLQKGRTVPETPRSGHGEGASAAAETPDEPARLSLMLRQVQHAWKQRADRVAAPGGPAPSPGLPQCVLSTSHGGSAILKAVFKGHGSRACGNMPPTPPPEEIDEPDEPQPPKALKSPATVNSAGYYSMEDVPMLSWEGMVMASAAGYRSEAAWAVDTPHEASSHGSVERGALAKREKDKKEKSDKKEKKEKKESKGKKEKKEKKAEPQASPPRGSTSPTLLRDDSTTLGSTDLQLTADSAVGMQAAVMPLPSAIVPLTGAPATQPPPVMPVPATPQLEDASIRSLPRIVIVEASGVGPVPSEPSVGSSRHSSVIETPANPAINAARPTSEGTLESSPAELVHHESSSSRSASASCSASSARAGVNSRAVAVEVSRSSSSLGSSKASTGIAAAVVETSARVSSASASSRSTARESSRASNAHAVSAETDVSRQSSSISRHMSMTGSQKSSASRSVGRAPSASAGSGVSTDRTASSSGMGVQRAPSVSAESTKSSQSKVLLGSRSSRSSRHASISSRHASISSRSERTSAND